MLGSVHAQVSRRVQVSVSDREFPALTGRSGTQRARHLGRRDGWHLGVLVLVTAPRATHYEGVRSGAVRPRC